MLYDVLWVQYAKVFRYRICNNVLQNYNFYLKTAIGMPVFAVARRASCCYLGSCHFPDMAFVKSRFDRYSASGQSRYTQLPSRPHT